MLRFVPGFLRSRAVLPVAVALTALLALPTLWLGRVWDDHLQRELLANAGPGDAAMGLYRFVRPPTSGEAPGIMPQPWWTAAELRFSFWRPLSALTHWADYRMVGDDVRWQHLHSIAWGAALTLLAGLLYRRLLGAGLAAGIATLFFAVDHAHNIPIAWLANRSALIASVFALGALLGHDSWRRRGWRLGAFVGPALFACALLGGELGAGIGPFFVAYALILDPEPKLGPRLRSVVPYVAVGIAWQAGYSAMGFGAAHSAIYVDPLHSPLRFLAMLPRKVVLLLASQFGPVAADMSYLSSTSVQRGLLVFSGLVVLAVGAALAPLVGRDRNGRFLSFGMLVSLLPVCATLPSDRLLLLSGFGAFGLLGLFVAGVAEGAEWVAAGWRRHAMRGFAALMILIHGPFTAISFLGRIEILKRVDTVIVRNPAKELPVGPEITKQHLVCVATSGPYFFALTLAERRLLGLPSPRMYTGLATGSTSIRITRVDERTLRLEPDGGFLPPHGTLVEEGGGPPPPVSVRYLNQAFEGMFREREAEWHVGDGSDRDGVAIRVTALTADRRPAAIEARFAERLGSSAYAWVVYTAGKYQTWTPPAVGETTRTKDVKLPL